MALFLSLLLSADNKQLLDEVFVISRIIEPSASADNPYRDLDYSGKKPNLMIVSLYIEQENKGHVFASSLMASSTKRANVT